MGSFLISFNLSPFFPPAIFLKACRILLSGDHSEWNALIEAEGNTSDVSMCDRYLNHAAIVFAADCTRGILMFDYF